MNPTEKYKTLKEIVDYLKSSEYIIHDSQDFPKELNNDVAFKALEAMAKEEEEIREMMKKINEENPFVQPELNTEEAALKFIIEMDVLTGEAWSSDTNALAKAMVKYANKFLITEI